MGAIPFCYKLEGSNPYSLYEELVKEAIEEHGEDTYNGTISTTEYRGITKSFPKYSEATVSSAKEYIKDVEYGNKRDCCVIDLGVKSYAVTTIKKKKQKSNATYKIQYGIYNGYGKQLAVKPTQKEAEEAAIKFTFAEQNVEIRKEPKKVSGNNVIEELYTERKTYEKKPKIKESPTKKIEEIHVYYFYGWAAE